MSVGRVNAELEASVRIRLGAPGGEGVDLDAVVDTGFNGFLAVPPDIVAALELPFSAPTRATLGDGSVVQLSVYDAVASLNDRTVDVEVLETVGGTLAGMAFLLGHKLTIEVVEGGVVAIAPLS